MIPKTHIARTVILKLYLVLTKLKLLNPPILHEFKIDPLTGLVVPEKIDLERIFAPQSEVVSELIASVPQTHSTANEDPVVLEGVAFKAVGTGHRQPHLHSGPEHIVLDGLSGAVAIDKIHRRSQDEGQDFYGPEEFDELADFKQEFERLYGRSNQQQIARGSHKSQPSGLT